MILGVLFIAVVLWLAQILGMALAGESNDKGVGALIDLVFINLPVIVAACGLWVKPTTLRRVILIVVGGFVYLVNHVLLDVYENAYFRFLGHDIRGYAVISGKLYHDKKRVKNVDLESFEAMEMEFRRYYPGQDRRFYKDKNHVFRFGKMIEGADRDSFTLLSVDLAKDKDSVFYIYDSKIVNVEGVDMATLKITDPSGCYQDKNNYYLDAVKLDVPDDFRPLPADKINLSCMYGMTPGFIWYQSSIKVNHLVPEDVTWRKYTYTGDLDSTLWLHDFSLLSDNQYLYKKDETNKAFVRLDKPDLPSLEKIKNQLQENQQTYGHDFYYKDKKAVYFFVKYEGFVELTSASVDAFSLVPQNHKNVDATDGQRCYSKGKLTEFSYEDLNIINE